MSLLSPQQILDIEATFKLVGDTFFVTPVTYNLKGDSLDRFQEDRQNQANTAYNCLGLVEYGDQDSDKLKETKDGKRDESECTVSLLLDDLKALGLVDAGNLFIGKAERDTFTTNNVDYEVVLAKLDGPLSQKNILVILKGKRKVRNS